MSGYDYGYEHNRCEGFYVATARSRATGEVSRSARKLTRDDAIAAIGHHYRKGLWPREVVASPVAICEACGQPLPDDGA